MTVTRKQAQEARAAEFAAWGEQSKVLGKHHILSIELVRTRDDGTAAVFTVYRHHKPVQYVVHGDSCGRPKSAGGQSQTQSGEAAPMMMRSAVVSNPKPEDGPPYEADMALGEPPPKEPPPPGIVALGQALLSTAFDLGEQLPG